MKPQEPHSANRCFSFGLQCSTRMLLPIFKNQRFNIKNLGPHEKLEDLTTLGQHSHKKLTGGNYWLSSLDGVCALQFNIVSITSPSNYIQNPTISYYFTVTSATFTSIANIISYLDYCNDLLTLLSSIPALGVDS